MKKKFEFSIGQHVTLAASKEKGRVIGRAKYETGLRQYLVRYVAADGRQEEAWFGADALRQQSVLEVISTSMRDANIGRALVSPPSRDQEIAKIKASLDAMDGTIMALQSTVASLDSRFNAVTAIHSGGAVAQ